MPATIRHYSSTKFRPDRGLGAAEPARREESFLHFLARECQWILRGIVIASAAATILLMFTLFYWAILPAMILLASYVLLLIADFIEYRTHRPGDPGWESELEGQAGVSAAAAPAHATTVEDIHAKRVRDAVTSRMTKTVIGIFASIGLVALVVAGMFLGREIMALGFMILFAYWLFIAAPLWLGWLEDEAEDEARRTEAEIQDEAS